MDANQIVQALKFTFFSNETDRKNAEEFLEKCDSLPGFPLALFQILIHSDMDMDVRQAAVIHLKNRVRRHWKKDSESSIFTPEVKSTIKENLILTICASPKAIQLQLGAILDSVIMSDFPHNWTNLLPQLIHLINSQNAPKIIGALFTLNTIAKRFEKVDSSNEKRTWLNGIVDYTFPVLVKFLEFLVNQDSLEVAEMQFYICNIFYCCFEFSIPPYLTTQEKVNPWIQLFLQLFQKPVPVEGEPEEDKEKDKWPYWRCKKIIAKIFERMITRYGSKKTYDTEYNKLFSDIFTSNYAVQLLPAVLNLLCSTMQPRMPKKLKTYCIEYLDSSTIYSQTWTLVKPHLQFLINNLLFPIVSFNEEDLEIYEDDPQEFIRQQSDFFSDLYDARTAVLGFLRNVVKRRGDEHLETFVNHSVTIFKSCSDGQQSSQSQVYGAMLVLEELSNLIKKSEIYSKNNLIETIILNYVVPHIKSSHGFMRARACSTFGKFWNIKYTMGDIFLLAVQSLINALNDQDLPVKLYGAISLRNLVRTRIVKANIVPILPQIVESVLKLMSEVDNEYLVEVLEYLIDKFTDQLKVFLPQICVGLAEQFVRICSKDDFFSEFNFNEKKDLSTPAAIQSLKTIQTLLYCARVDGALFPLLEPTIVTLLLRMEQRLNDLFPDFIEIMAVYAHYTEKINEGMWNVFGIYCQYIVDFADEHLKDFLVCIDNFVSKEPEVFAKGPHLQQVCNIYQTVLTSDKYGEAACLDASVLMEIILIFCKGKVDHILPQALELALQKVKDSKLISTRIGVFQVLICAIHCNPILVFNWLESKGWSKDVFTLWFQFITENIQTKHGLKLSNVALSSILRVPFAQWPPVLQPQFKFIVLTIGDLQKDLNKLLETDHSEAGDETESSNGESDIETGDDEEIEDALTEEEQKLLGDLGGKLGKPVSDTEDVSPALLSGEIHQRLYALYEEQKTKEEEEEGYQEDDDLENLLEDIDEIVYFKQSLEVFSQQQPQIFEQFIQSLNPEEREKVNYLMNYRRESENNNNTMVSK